MEFVTLSNGIKMPKIGYGVYQVTPAECERCVLEALDIGYRAIDTAQGYENEREVGAAIKKSGIPREEIFITTKTWIAIGGYEQGKKAIDASLQKLDTDYIDLLLIHQPYNDYYGVWRAMEEAYKAGKLKAIGVANFYADRLIDLLKHAEIPPMVDQLETHIFWQQQEAHKYMEKYNVVHESWAPFAEGRNNFFKTPLLHEIGAKHGKTAAQIALRYLLQSDVVIIPKSTHKERMQENLDILDFTLDEADMNAIAALDRNKSLFFYHNEPDTTEMLIGLEGRVKVY